MTVANTLNRRRHERFVLPPMYTVVEVRRARDLRIESLHGHAYDLSEVGLRIELDEPLTPGEQVALTLSLPGEDGAIHASAEVVWTADEADDPGPRRSALRLSDFQSDADRRRIRRFLGAGWARAA